MGAFLKESFTYDGFGGPQPDFAVFGDDPRSGVALAHALLEVRHAAKLGVLIRWVKAGAGSS